MKLKIILTKNGKRFDRLYSHTETDIFEFYSKLSNETLAAIAQEIEEQDGYVTVDLNTETLAATVGFQNVSDETKDEIKSLLFPFE